MLNTQYEHFTLTNEKQFLEVPPELLFMKSQNCNFRRHSYPGWKSHKT